MFDLVARLIGGAVSPLLQQVSAFGASLLKKLALFLVAGICLVVVVIALTVAFALWIASLAGPIVGVLAVALLYFIVAAVAVGLALRSNIRPAAVAVDQPVEEEHAAEQTSRAAQIEQFIAPLLNILGRFGLRREQLAVLAGASVAKQLRPVPLVGLAIVAGFLVGRMWKGWGAMISTDLVATVLGLLGYPRPGSEEEAEPENKAA